MLPGKDETCKPCAMIRFGSVEMATWVVENLNGNIPEGLAEPIITRFANANNDKGKGKDNGKGGGWKSEPYSGGGSWGKGASGGSWGKAGGAAKGGDPAPSDNVWIGDLPVGTEQSELANIFEAYGQIVTSRMLPGRDPSAKPCALIRFASVEMAKWVVDNLNGNIPQGCQEPIVARFANAQRNQGGDAGGGWDNGKGQAWQSGGKGGGKWDAGKAGGKGGKGKPGGAPGSFHTLFQSVKGAGILGGGTVPDECQCFVKNLPADTTDLELYKLFAPFGAIPPTGVKAMLNADGSCKGIGFVDFSDPTAAATAVVALDGHTCPDGSTIGVSQKQASKKGKGKKGDGGKGE